jgi:hypothetical protein
MPNGPLQSVKQAQAIAKRIKMSIYQLPFENDIPGEPIIVKGRIRINKIEPFLVIVLLDDMVGFLSFDKDIQPIDMQELPRGMVDRIKPISTTGLGTS